MEKVSVIIPCYNDGIYIKESIESVNSQTYSNIEIIICDDGSTDENTLSILSSLNQKNLTVIHLKNGGPAVARNKGIKIAAGEYILPLDADDKIEKTYIEKAVRILKSDDNIGVVYCYAELFGTQTGRWLLPNYSFEEMMIDNVVFVTALFRKSDWISVGGFCEDFKHGIEDYDFWLSILELNKKIIQIPEVLFYYRIKTTSRTSLFNNNIEALQKTYDMLYERHKILYQNNMDLYCKALRRTLIGRIAYTRQLEEALAFKEKINKFPVIKKIMKKIYLKIFSRSSS